MIKNIQASKNLVKSTLLARPTTVDVFGNYELAFLTLGFILIVPIIAIWFMKIESKLAP